MGFFTKSTQDQTVETDTTGKKKSRADRGTKLPPAPVKVALSDEERKARRERNKARRAKRLQSGRNPHNRREPHSRHG